MYSTSLIGVTIIQSNIAFCCFDEKFDGMIITRSLDVEEHVCYGED